jgi:hypothetical protein
MRKRQVARRHRLAKSAVGDGRIAGSIGQGDAILLSRDTDIAVRRRDPRAAEGAIIVGLRARRNER